jgi:hypothetical protein
MKKELRLVLVVVCAAFMLAAVQAHAATQSEKPNILVI